MGWETPFEDGKAWGAKLKLKRLNPLLWLVNPEQKVNWTGDRVLYYKLYKLASLGGGCRSIKGSQGIFTIHPVLDVVHLKNWAPFPRAAPNKIAGWPRLPQHFASLCVRHSSASLSAVPPTAKPCLGPPRSLHFPYYCPAAAAFFCFLHIICYIVLFVYITASKSFQRKSVFHSSILEVRAVSQHLALGKDSVMIGMSWIDRMRLVGWVVNYSSELLWF